MAPRLSKLGAHSLAICLLGTGRPGAGFYSNAAGWYLREELDRSVLRLHLDI